MNDCIIGFEMNESWCFEEFADELWKTNSDNYLGDCNIFEIILSHIQGPPNRCMHYSKCSPCSLFALLVHVFVTPKNCCSLLAPYERTATTFAHSSVDPAHINEILNFQFETFTMSLIRMNQLISKNVLQFRKDFKIEKLFRIKNRGKEKCYVIVSNLKPYWITTSLDNFLYGWKKIKLFDEQTSGVFIWVRLTKNDTH